jgi:HD-GYP domain-containing protein (c-di-GMP phosphodiesterase class II)
VDDAPRFRLAETLAALSMVTDAAIGYPGETAVRATLVATRLAEDLGVGPQERSRIYYTTLLRYVGCTASAHEAVVHLSDDDVHVNHRLSMVDAGRPMEAAGAIFSVLGRGRSPLVRARRVASFAVHGSAVAHEVDTSHCEVATRLASRFGLDREVSAALYQITERWDGKGAPRKLRGDTIALPARYAVLAHIAADAASHESGGDPAAVVRRLGGTWLDPSLAAAFVTRADGLLEEIGQPDAWEQALAAEPAPFVTVSPQRIEDVAAGFADAVDLKSPYLQGHSTAVARLADVAAGVLGRSEEERRRVRCAGLLHDVGRVAVPTGVWEKPGPLSVAERDQVQAHTYLTERILTRSPALAPLASLAASHHERLDGSGYHRGMPAAMLDPLARVLAAADVYRALVEDRPYRPAFAGTEAATSSRRWSAAVCWTPPPRRPSARRRANGGAARVRRTPAD